MYWLSVKQLILLTFYLKTNKVKNQIYIKTAFDYVAIDKDVTACDMSSIPLEDQEIDAMSSSACL